MGQQKEPQLSVMPLSSKAAYVDEMEFSHNYKPKSRWLRKKTEKEDYPNDLFCKAMASELKELPTMAK